MTPEIEYINSTSITHRKKFAQFFTPDVIAEFMTRWLLNGIPGEKILEPAMGLGIFSRFLLNQNANLKINGYDIDENILEKAKTNFTNPNHNISFLNKDYMSSSWEDIYDGIICNPPYLKFHDYDNDMLVELTNKALHTNLSKFSNLYSLFLMKSLSQLSPNGKCAYIIPSEFLNSDYGIEVKRFILNTGMDTHIIALNFKENIFDGAITTSCILLCTNKPDNGTIRFSFINDIKELQSVFETYQIHKKIDIRPEIKWKNYYAGNNSSQYRNLTNFSNYAKVSRGIATGANHYFAFTKDRALDLSIPAEALMKCICHCSDINKIIFTAEDFKQLEESNKKVYLFKGSGNEQNPTVKEYIRYGEYNGINDKYLCKNRMPWYSIEKRQPAPIWVSVFNRGGLKFIRNEAAVSNLTTFHCIYVNSLFVDPDVFFAYLLTDLANKIFLDNSREYGNGLIKFEPNDLNNAKTVDFSELSSNDISLIKSLYEKFKINEERCYLNEIEKIFINIYSYEPNVAV